jgi:hypothetical protein
MTTTDDFWKPFGEAQWREFATTVSASELQLRYAVCRFNGSTATAAAKLAGYAGDKEAIRRAGYSATRSTAVVALLELAETHAPQAAGLTDAEVDAKVAKLVRSPDPQISLKATELFDRRKQRQRELQAAQPEENLEEQLASIITSVTTQGVGGFLALECYLNNGGAICNYPFLPETAPLIARYFPAEWQKLRIREGKHIWLTDFLDKAAANPVLEDTALIAAIKTKLPRVRAPKLAEADNAS